ncbi:exosome RNA helicase MTR4-like [Glossina fuscipes fuscipes]
MHIKDADFKNIVDSIHKLEERLFGHPLHRSSNTSSGYTLYKGKLTVLEQLKIVETKLKEARSLLQMDKLKFRKRVLRRVQYCIAAEVIEFKGRVTCELSPANELLITEMIFNGVFNDLTTPQTVALLSWFVC